MNVDDTYIRLTLGPVSLDIVLCNYIIDYREVFKINLLIIRSLNLLAKLKNIWKRKMTKDMA